jgi:DNA-binding transcriptional LysR family regulator
MRVDYILRADLNLLPALAALLDERQVSRAAARVGMSQPAMSRTLQRLRDVLGDDLLVRGRGGYQLTPRAERIQRQVAELLPQLDNLFSDQAFDPATATDVFRLSGTDYATTILGPALFQQVFRQAPHATLSFETWQDGVFDDMERGALDLVLYGLAPRAGMRSEELFEERFVCVMSPEHPLSGHARITLDDYLACQHVVVNIHGGWQTVIDHRLRALGRPRHASLTVPYHAAAPYAVPGTALVATVPARLAAKHADISAVRTVAPPREIEVMHFNMCWHPRLDDDRAQRWLREIIRSVTATYRTEQSAERTGLRTRSGTSG